ncbi:hypothetical protein C0991_005227 [Blastosporella zonata]|nr:hypothetical protein C0991_005227 [Blastosporella zonata]
MPDSTLKSLRQRKRLNTPPVIHLSDVAQFKHTRQAYESALQRYGSVVGIYRKNRLEYIVDESHTSEVLTNDVLFSAERGTAAVQPFSSCNDQHLTIFKILNLPILNILRHSIIAALDKVVTKAINPSLDGLVTRLGPVFERYMFKLAAQADGVSKPLQVDLAQPVHYAMAESMLLLIIGERNPDRALMEDVIKVAFDLAIIAGLYQNIGYWSRTFPTTWRIFIWIRLMIFTIPWTYRKIAWRIWKALKEARKTGNIDHIDPVRINISNAEWLMVIVVLKECILRYLVKDNEQVPGIMESIWLTSLSLGYDDFTIKIAKKTEILSRLFFASIHQTSGVIIWVVYEMAVRRDIQPALREELSDILEIDCESGKPTLTYASLRRAELLDSFIREVFRTKGDTLAVIRLTTKDVPLGGYVIPKGSFITPLATLSHESVKNWGDDADKFMSDRWIGTGKTAASISTAYWPFGLGRFACPGRFVAVAEIKLMVLYLISRVDISMEGGKYEVIDPMNTVAVPPRGKLLFLPLEKPLL